MIAHTIFDEPYLSTKDKHQGLLALRIIGQTAGTTSPKAKKFQTAKARCGATITRENWR